MLKRENPPVGEEAAGAIDGNDTESLVLRCPDSSACVSRTSRLSIEGCELVNGVMTTQPQLPGRLDALVESSREAIGFRSRKRVAFFLSCDSFEGFYGGTFGLDRETFLSSYRNDFVWQYAQGLCNRGHYVVIYILSYGSAGLQQISGNLCVRFLHLPVWLRITDAFFYRLRGVQRGASLRDHIAHLGYGHALQVALTLDRVDVLYHQEIWTPRFDISVRSSKIPVVGADHGAIYADWMGPAKRRSMGLACHVTCQSETALQRALAFGARAEILYNGVDTNFFSPPQPELPRSKTVLTVGRLVETQKRFSDLLRAMQLLPDFSLTLVGAGPDLAMLKQLAAELGVVGRVDFTGFIGDRDALRTLYGKCGVFASASSWEAAALVVLEAMSCGAPIVATRIPSFEDLLENDVDGILVPVGAPEELARAIQTAYRRQKEFGENGRKTVVARHSASLLYERLSEILQSV